MRREVWFLIFGTFSGLLSFFIVIGTEFLPAIIYIPGVIFSVIFTFSIFHFKQSLLKHLLLFSFFSILGYFLAFSTTLTLWNKILTSFKAIPLITGGLLGTVIMLIGYTLFIKRLHILEFTGVTVVGGLLSLSYYFIPNGTFFAKSDLLSIEGLLSLFLIWQTAMFFLLGVYLPKS